MRLLLLTGFLFTLSLTSLAADRYWIASSSSNWNNTANWSTVSGGTGGASVPAVTDTAIFDANGLGNCNVDVAVDIAEINVENTFSSAIDLNGFAFSITSTEANFLGGTINDTPGTSQITINISGYTRFGSGVIINTPVVSTSGSIRLDGTTFNSTTSFTKTNDAISDFSTGGNTFVGNCFIENTADAILAFGNVSPDDWQANLTLVGSNGTTTIARASAGNTIAGTLNATLSNNAAAVQMSEMVGSEITVSGTATFTNLGNTDNGITIGGDGNVNFLGDLNVVNNAAVGAVGVGRVTLAFGASSNITVAGSADFDMIGIDSIRVFIALGGQVHFQSDLSMSNDATGAYSFLVVSENGTSNTIVDGTTFIETNNAATWKRIHLGSDGDVTFNATLTLRNNSTTAIDNDFSINAGSGTVYFNDDILMNSVNPNARGFFIGNSSGACFLASGQTISVGSGGYSASGGVGRLRLTNFTQLGNTPQSIDLGTSVSFQMYTSTWNGPVTIRTSQILWQNNTFNNDLNFEKYNSDWAGFGTGNNTFNGTTVIENNGPGLLRMGITGPEDFNGDVTYLRNSTGHIQPAHNNLNTYAQDVTLNAPAFTIDFGTGTNGGLIFDGTVSQEFNLIGGTNAPTAATLGMNNTGLGLNLTTPIEVREVLDLVDGNITSSTTNLITMLDDAVVTSVSNNSYVDGPIIKIGDDAFTFPVGESGFYRPAGISAPASATAQFRGEYLQVDPHPMYDHNSLDPTLVAISSCEYWYIDRLVGTDAVTVELSWNNALCNAVATPADVAVARWDGAVWRDHGNGGTTGTAAAGTVLSSGAVSSFSPFTLASYTTVNPLPIELLSFDAALNGRKTDLTWRTATEWNNDYFEIEKSQDGINWDAFHVQSGAGNSQVEQQYQAIDFNPFDGVTYYRLKQVDFDGSFTYSDIRTVNLNGTNIFVYPNPVKDNFSIQGLEVGDFYQIHANDGRLIHSGISGNVNTFNWSSGVYLLTIYDDQENLKEQLKVIK